MERWRWGTTQGALIACVLACASLAIAAPGGGSRGAFFGVRTEAHRGGLAVLEVAPASPAEQAGIAIGDIIVSIDGVPLHQPVELVEIIAASQPGRALRLHVLRERNARNVVATLVAPTGPPRRARGPVVGQAAPEVRGTLITGTDAATLSALRGRVVVLDFWATWCGPCRAVMPELESLHQSLHGQGLTVLGLSSENESTIRGHLARHPVSYTIARDPGAAAASFGVYALPTLIVIDRSGQVRDVHVGADRAAIAGLRGDLTRLLSEPAP